MNDFLQSLRNGQADKGRPHKTRKSYDNSYHYSSGPRYNSYGNGYQNTRSQQMKRPMPQSGGNQAPADDSVTTSLLTDAIETLGIHIETLAKNQEYLINAQERTADMLERQALAIERIVSHLNIDPGLEEEQSQPAVPEETYQHHYVTPAKPEPVEVDETPKPMVRKRKKIVAAKPAPRAAGGNELLSREEILNIISSMRKEGATYDQVASHLVELGQPTFSGRGEWHAQTIHRLCNRK